MSLFPPTLLGGHRARHLGGTQPVPADPNGAQGHGALEQVPRVPWASVPLLSTTQGQCQPASEAHSPTAPVSLQQSWLVPHWLGQLRTHLARAGRGREAAGEGGGQDSVSPPGHSAPLRDSRGLRQVLSPNQL